MAKRYLGGGISFEQERVYQEFSEDDTPSGGGSLATLSDVDISNPTDGQVLVYNAASGKWENAGGGDEIFVTLGTINADTVNMTYDEESDSWRGAIFSDIPLPNDGVYAIRNLVLTINGVSYSADPFSAMSAELEVIIGEMESLYLVCILSDNNNIGVGLLYAGQTEPVITNLTAEVYAPSAELAVLIPYNPK